MTKLSSSLPKEYEEDGLGSINRELIARPQETHIVIAVVDCKSITTDIDSGYDVATARILHIEPMKDPEAENRARDMLHAAQERRTGRRALPLVDGGTGEILRNGSGILGGNVTVLGGGKP